MTSSDAEGEEREERSDIAGEQKEDVGLDSSRFKEPKRVKKSREKVNNSQVCRRKKRGPRPKGSSLLRENSRPSIEEWQS